MAVQESSLSVSGLEIAGLSIAIVSFLWVVLGVIVTYVFKLGETHSTIQKLATDMQKAIKKIDEIEKTLHETGKDLARTEGRIEGLPVPPSAQRTLD